MTQEELWTKMDKHGFGYTKVLAIPDNIDELFEESDGTHISDMYMVYIEKQGSWEAHGYIDRTSGGNISWYQDDQPKQIVELPCGSICVVEW